MSLELTPAGLALALSRPKSFFITGLGERSVRGKGEGRRGGSDGSRKRRAAGVELVGSKCIAVAYKRGPLSGRRCQTGKSRPAIKRARPD